MYIGLKAYRPTKYVLIDLRSSLYNDGHVGVVRFVEVGESSTSVSSTLTDMEDKQASPRTSCGRVCDEKWQFNVRPRRRVEKRCRRKQSRITVAAARAKSQFTFVDVTTSLDAGTSHSNIDGRRQPSYLCKLQD